MTTLVFQTDPDLPGPFHRGGCHLLAHAAIVELELDQGLPPPLLETLAARLQARGVLTADLALPTEAGPYQTTKETALLLDQPHLAARQVGSIDAGKVSFWRSVERHYFDWAILRGVSPTGGMHSVLCDRHQVECYNPYPGLRIVSRAVWLLYQVISA